MVLVNAEHRHSLKLRLEFKLFENLEFYIIFAKLALSFLIFGQIFIRGLHNGISIPILIIHPIFLAPSDILKNFDVMRVTNKLIPNILG